MKAAVYFHCLLIMAVLSSCANPSSNKTLVNTDTLPKNKGLGPKPGSSFNDSLVISTPAAVFYSPDSIQLEKLRLISNKGIFDATMHEFESQFHNAHNILKKEWKQIKVIDSRNKRFLVFIKENGQRVVIDLDTKGDPYGLFISDTKKDPVLTDMMNIDTQLYYYFK